MLRQFKILKQALAYAKFSDRDIEENVKELIEQMGTELDNEGYEPNEGIEQIAETLEKAMDELDSEVENINDAIQSAGDSDEDEDEDGGSTA